MAAPKGMVTAPSQEGDTEERVYVRSFDGQLGSVPLSGVQAHLENQGTLITSEEDLRLARARAEAADAPLQAAAEGAARGATLGLSDVALEALGADTEGLRLRQEENPVASTIGEVGGSLLGAVGTGGGGLLARGAATGAKAGLKGAARTAARVAASPAQGAVAAGKTVEGLVARGLGGKVAPKVAQVMAKGAGLATEGAAFGVGQTVSEEVLDPNYTPDALISNVGLGAILGGGLGILGPLAGHGAVRGASGATRASANAARLLGNKASGIISKVSGTSEQQLKFLTSSEKALREVAGEASKKAKAHAEPISKALFDVDNVSKSLAHTPTSISPKLVRRLVKASGGPKVAQEAAEMSLEFQNMVARATAEGGENAALRGASKAIGEYDTAISKLSVKDSAGRWQAASRLRNSLAGTPDNKPIVSMLDDFLESRDLFGKLGTAKGKLRASGDALGELDANLQERFFDAGLATREKAEAVLGELSDLKKSPDLQSIRMQSKALRTYADDLERVADLSPELKTQVRRARAAAKELDRATEAAGKDVVPANLNRDAVLGQVNNVTGGIAKAAESMLGHGPLGKAAASALGGGAGSLVAGAAFGPTAGAAAGLYNIARNPQQFLGTIHRMLNLADDVKLRQNKRLDAWLQGKKGVSGRVAPKLSPAVKRLSEGKPSERRKAFAEYRSTLSEQANKPQETMEKVQANLSPLKDAAPKLAERIASLSVARLAWLLQRAPQHLAVDDPFAMGTGETDIDDASLDRFARLAAVVENPAVILDRITTGEVTTDEVEALKETAPGMHASIVEHLAEVVPNNPDIHYNKKLTLGVVFDVPTVPALQPQMLDTFQQSFAEDEQQPPQPLSTNAPTPASQSRQSPLDAAVQR